MLTEKEEQIIIDALKPYQPTRLAWSSYPITFNSKCIEILYDFKKTPGMIEFIGVEQQLEKKLNKKIDFTGFDYIPRELKSKVLNESQLFFNGKREERDDSFLHR
ncbi:MAG: nucleotidyltransferase [Flavobacteriaceae bacterium]|nr:nucleotidyltransferase [Flavobacteriaceae bacterium]